MHENTSGTSAATPVLNGSYNAELKPDARKPRDVLRDLMHFYDTKFKDIAAEVILRLREEPASKGNASDIAVLVKAFHESAKMAIQCAEKLAPYEHPKLESIEVKKELTHRFVIRAPAATIDTAAWVHTAQEEQKLLASKPGHDLIKEVEKPKVNFNDSVIFTNNPIVGVFVTVGDDPYDPDNDIPDDDDEDYDI